MPSGSVRLETALALPPTLLCSIGPLSSCPPLCRAPKRLVQLLTVVVPLQGASVPFQDTFGSCCTCLEGMSPAAELRSRVLDLWAHALTFNLQCFLYPLFPFCISLSSPCYNKSGCPPPQRLRPSLSLKSQLYRTVPFACTVSIIQSPLAART